MKKFGIILIVIALTIFSCAKKEEKLTGEQGGKMVIGTTDLPGTISPLQPNVLGSNEILDLLFMKLHRIDATGKMKPELASSWEFSEDLKAITYYLRKDIKWWDGEPVTAEDVLYTYEKMVDPKTNYPFVSSFNLIKKVELIDKYTIKFTFNQVYANLITDSDIMPIPKHIYEKIGDEFGKSKIVGNGPYRVKEWVPNSGLVLTANDEYYRGRPPLDEIIIKYYNNVEAMITDFEQGNLDFALNLSPAEAKRLSGNQNINVASKPGNSYIYLGWNLNNEFLKDKEIRKALTMAINRTQILNDIFLGMGKISLGPLPHSSWAFNENIATVEYNLEKAKNILTQRGFEDRNRNKILDKNGKDFTLTIIANVENPERVQILSYVTNYLTQLGIKVNAQKMDVNSFISALLSGKYDGFIMGWSVGDKIDPTLYWHSDPKRGKFNFISYKNTAVDSLIELGTILLNRKKAKEVWGEFQRIVYEDQPYTFLIVPNEISATYKRVKGTGQGVNLASAYTYWIPASERKVTVAAVITPPTPTPTSTTTTPTTTTPTTTTPTTTKTETKVETTKPPAQAVSPEKLLEAAAASKETTATVTPPPTTTPFKPSVITRPVPVKQIKPKYPEAAKAIGATGKVVVKVLVGTDGKVKSASIYSSFGNPACEDAALTAAKQWEFKPATKDGEPFEQSIQIPFDFKP